MIPSRTTPQRSAMGFSGVDLLAVVAIVAVVGAVIAVPWIRSTRAARVTLCTDHLRQIAQAIHLYAEDHRKTLPGPVAGQGGDFWWWYKEQIRPYLPPKNDRAVQDTVFVCPDDRGYSDPAPFCRTPRFDFSSYVFNGVLLPGMPNIAGWQQGAVVEPRRTLLVMEWAAHAPLSWHRSRTGVRNGPFYRDAECVVAFTDGHAGLIPIYYDGYNAAYTRDPIAGYAYRFSGN
jgi:hypothetical protein